MVAVSGPLGLGNSLFILCSLLAYHEIFPQYRTAPTATFHRLREYSAVDAISLCYELTLPIHQIVEEHFLRITVSQASGYGARDGDVEAMSLRTHSELNYRIVHCSCA